MTAAIWWIGWDCVQKTQNLNPCMTVLVQSLSDFKKTQVFSLLLNIEEDTGSWLLPRFPKITAKQLAPKRFQGGRKSKIQTVSLGLGPAFDEKITKRDPRWVWVLASLPVIQALGFLPTDTKTLYFTLE